jgi:hypothetical protein
MAWRGESQRRGWQNGGMKSGGELAWHRKRRRAAKMKIGVSWRRRGESGESIAR